MTMVTDAKLKARGHGTKGCNHILVKTHRWSDDWHPDTANIVLLTHRDLREVVASYRRVGWAFDIPKSYVEEHQRWRAIAHHDFAFEDIMAEPNDQLGHLAKRLGLQDKVDLASAAQRLQALKPPASGPPDPVTKLWPQHISQQTHEGRTGSAGDGPSADSLLRRFPAYFEQYRYAVE